MNDSSRAAPRWWRPAAASALAYFIATAVLGREILRDPAVHVLHDVGDPLLTAAILKWNSTHLPLTDAWWQFPIFFPTRNALAFSENLLGLSVIATPFEWLIGSPLVAYNLVALLTFPLCGIAMYAFVYRLTRSAAGAFVAGVSFAFAPYRVSQLPHVQMLAAFYMPLALLGLHEYVASGRRRWLALYGAGWLLQGLANGYCVFFFSLLVGFWGLWFVVRQRRWRALVEIVAATLVAAIPLAAVLYKYLLVHEFQGFTRSIIEMRQFSADVGGLLCAPPSLSFWGWIHTACRDEGEVFPGVATFILFLLGAARVLGWPRDHAAQEAPNRALMIAARVVLTIGLAYTVFVAAIALAGPIHVDVGFVHASATSILKSGIIGMVALLVALVLTPMARHGVTESSPLPFYLVAAVLTWTLALGPSIFVMGNEAGISGPFSWLLRLPGTDSLRVPARFWLMTVLCLGVVVGIVAAELVKTRRRAIAAMAVVLLGSAVFADGAVNHFVWEPAPRPLPNEAALTGGHVIFLPIGESYDIASTYRAGVGGWRSVNGYSGYLPAFYQAVFQAERGEDPSLLEAFQRYGPLDVIVPHDAPRLRAIVEQQAGVVTVARDDAVTQYRLPAKTVDYRDASGLRLPVTGIDTNCARGTEARVLDGDLSTAWLCPQTTDAEFTIDVGRPAAVGAVVTEMGRLATEWAHTLTVDTSVDGNRWEPAWSGSALGPIVWAAIEQPTVVPLTISFAPREARFIRMRQTGRDPLHPWGIAELQVYSR